MVRFSVIIPTYNRSGSIVRALRSVLAQTVTDFEVLVVDDGSTDDTERAVSDVEDHRLSYYKKQNEERSIARNYGVGKAKGEYVTFLDSDDYLYANHLQEATHVIGRYDHPEVFHLGYEIKDGESVVQRMNDFPEVLNQDLTRENRLSCNGMFIRRDVAVQFPFIGHRDAVFAEDWYVWLRLGARFRIYNSNAVTSVVNLHRGRSLSMIDPYIAEKSIRLVLERLDADRQVAEYYKEGYRFFRAENLSLVSLLFSEHKAMKHKAWKYLKDALFAEPGIIVRRRFWAIVRNILKP
jgi:glycosyltransferase involved in cell wall biosynthesis